MLVEAEDTLISSIDITIKSGFMYVKPLFIVIIVVVGDRMGTRRGYTTRRQQVYFPLLEGRIYHLRKSFFAISTDSQSSR
jgi:hypothetical protein